MLANPASATGGTQAAADTETWLAHAGQVSMLFWLLVPLAALCTMGAWLGWWAIDSAPVLLAAIGVMLIGGLPHGACDIALAGAAWHLGWRDMAVIVLGYVAVGGLMAVLWWFAPVIALLVFLALAGLHFGEDWTMLPPGLLRSMAGLAVIATAALGQRGPVIALFGAMTGSSWAEPIAQWAAAAAPMMLLVTLVGLALAWQAGLRLWVMAQTLGYAALLMLPPLIGFTLFFVGLHAPLHWRQAMRRMPRPWRRNPVLGHGIAFTALVLTVWLGVVWLRGMAGSPGQTPVRVGGAAFCLLSTVAAPHLALSLAIDRHIRARATATPPARHGV